MERVLEKVVVLIAESFAWKYSSKATNCRPIKKKKVLDLNLGKKLTTEHESQMTTKPRNTSKLFPLQEHFYHKKRDLPNKTFLKNYFSVIPKNLYRDVHQQNSFFINYFARFSKCVESGFESIKNFLIENNPMWCLY